MADSRQKDVIPPLAYDRDGHPFKRPKGMVAWKLREDKGKPGRPGVVWGQHGIVHLSPGADMAQLRRAVDNRPGVYRLYPVDRFGRDLEPYAVAEVTPAEPDEPDEPTITARDALDELVSALVAKLVTSIAATSTASNQRCRARRACKRWRR